MNLSTWSEEAASSLLLPLQKKPGPVLIALQLLQKNFGYVHLDAVALIASTFNVSRADVHGVLTFYHDLRTSPPPKNSINICVAEACQAVGSRELVAQTCAELGVEIDQVGSEVEIKSAYCYGNCALGPAVMVNGELIGKADVAKIKGALI